MIYLFVFLILRIEFYRIVIFINKKFEINDIILLKYKYKIFKF